MHCFIILYQLKYFVFRNIEFNQIVFICCFLNHFECEFLERRAFPFDVLTELFVLAFFYNNLHSNVQFFKSEWLWQHFVTQIRNGFDVFSIKINLITVKTKNLNSKTCTHIELPNVCTNHSDGTTQIPKSLFGANKDNQTLFTSLKPFAFIRSIELIFHIFY